MPRQIHGSDALQRLDMSIADMRRMVADAMAAAENVNVREAEVRSEQVDHYRELADIRIDVIAGTIDDTQLDTLHKAARELLQQHEDYVASESQALSEADETLTDLEAQRAELATAHRAAMDAYEEKVAETEARLTGDPAYIALARASDQAAAIASRAHQKLAIAKTDLEEKGAPYQRDKLFAYLWRRGFRTPASKAGPFFRFLDGWVAGICGYDQAWMNYQRLSQLPEWLEGHAAEQDSKADAALEALEQAEQAALAESGAEALRQRADTLLADIQRTDQAIDAAEAEHQAIAQRHADALNADAGPARDARRLLEDGLRQTAFQDLRTLAAETIDLRDDQIVDTLVKLRTEEMSLDLEGERLSGLPDRLQTDLAALEDLRRRFKQARYDTSYAMFSAAALDDALAGLVSGRFGAERAFEYLSRSVKRIEPKAQPGFGGQPRSSTLGFPDVLGDVIWEIAKESSRGGGLRHGGKIGFPTSSGSRRRSPRIKIPRGGGKGGGFKTGGGF